MVYIYVLKLRYNKYYIGKTMNPKLRLDEHFRIGGSSWTKKYKPLGIIKIIPDCDNFDEDKYTIKYMKEYGINNVRGGSFCKIYLTDESKATLHKMIEGSSDKCYICGKKGHFANKCKNKSSDISLEDKPNGFYELDGEIVLIYDGILNEESSRDRVYFKDGTWCGNDPSIGLTPDTYWRPVSDYDTSSEEV